jgi:S-adenosylmethionine:tRNA ribosyltransferase-isomerase
MHIPSNINIEDYNYNLPEEKIAAYPKDKRDESKLLIWKDNLLSEDKFKNLANYLPSDSLMIFNNTKVIQARMKFHKESGAAIEIFCLEPIEPKEISQALSCHSEVRWNCLVGNAKKWKQGKLTKTIEVKNKTVRLSISNEGHNENSFQIKFTWDDIDICFGEILDSFGKTPLPPYIKRESTDDDKERYQCIYAKAQGSVAAPTAGLHYTNEGLELLKTKNIKTEEIILHVGAGTFRPVKSESLSEHIMHTEKIIVSRKLIESLLQAKQNNKKIISVGTTTMRTLESIYWHGVKILSKKATEILDIKQWEAYQLPQDYSLEESLEAILNTNKTDFISGQTQLIIAPGYKTRVVDILNTNFHQPKSTLLLLVAALIGSNWEKAYDYALKNDFRFLSYGDSCLFFKENC